MMSFFVYRGPLAPESPLFRGRESEIKHLTQLCQCEVQSYAIVFGGRQMGKTSLLLRLASRLPNHIRTCRVDFQGIPGATTSEVYTFLAQRVAQSLGAPSVSPIANAPELTRFLCQVLNETTISRLVLLMEEWGVLSQQPRHDLANVVRSMFSNRYDSSCSQLSKLMVVLAGGIELYELAASEVSTLHNICESIYLSSLTEAEAVGLVKDGFVNLGIDAATSQMLGKSIYKHVEGHPYLTQRLAGMQEGILAEGQGVTPSHVDSAVEQILTANDPLLRHLRGALVEHNLVASSQILLEGHLHFSRLDEEMAKLELIGIAKEANGCWQVRNSIIARIVKSLIPTSTTDFFISYNSRDKDWAEWIAWQLEEVGYTTIIQAWDFRPGTNFVLDMHRAAEQASRTIAVLSNDYLQAIYPQPEWAAVFAKDPTGQSAALLPVRVRECKLQGLLSQVIYIDLVGLKEQAAKDALLSGARRERAKPLTAPSFPGTTERTQPKFPG